MDQKRLWRIGLGIAVLAAAIVLIYAIRNALTPVFTALVAAYLLDPVVDRFAGPVDKDAEQVKKKRSVVILILAAVFVVLFVVVGSFLIIQAQREVVEVFHNMPTYIERVQSKVAPLAKEQLGMDLPETFTGAMDDIKNQIKNIDPKALKPVTAALGKATSSTLAFVSWIVGLAIIPVFLFYFLRDWDTLKYEALEYVPVPWRDYVHEKSIRIDEIVGAFLRGQLTICVVLGVLYSIGLMIAGVDLAVVIGMFAGLAFIVPYLGTVLGIVAAVAMSLLENGLSFQILGVFIVFGVVQLFEGTVLTPKVMGDKVGLSPVTVIFSLLVGAELLGLLGMLIAVPAAAVIKVFVDEGIEKYKQSEFFTGEAEGGPGQGG